MIVDDLQGVDTPREEKEMWDILMNVGLTIWKKWNVCTFFWKDKKVATIMHWINWRFLARVESIELDDFIQDFSLWCETQ